MGLGCRRVDVDALPTAVPSLGDEFDAWQIELHGHRVIYRIAGSGPPVVLIHGMVNSSRHWESVALRLADSYTVIAPDLIGHGDSATPRGDYSLGAHAASIRDLLTAIGIEKATIVGHSLGGGVAMQFFYQFPQRTERLVLVSSGGLGHEVSPLLRAAALPGATPLLALATRPRVLAALLCASDRLQQRGSSKGVYLRAVARALEPLKEPGAREAFLQTLRSVIDVRGQRVSARDRLYLLIDAMPTLIVWGGRDNTIPLSHGRDTHEAVPGSRFEILSRAAHFPHLEDPEGLAAVLRDFLETTRPAQIDDADWGGLIARHSPRRHRANKAVATSTRGAR
jgi:pimeloyl-ACP methyl ester carboxylesterase